jgi:aquaporin Z
LNPALTLAFWRLGKVSARDTWAYVSAQLAGALAGVAAGGALWGALARSVRYAALVPGPGRTWRFTLPFEALATFAVVYLVFVCVNRPSLAPRTGLIVGAFVTVLVTTAPPLSGPGINPARSLAPALWVPVYQDQWAYASGPIVGALAAAFAYRRRLGQSTVCAKLYHTAGHPCPFHCGYRLVRAGEVVMREGEPGDLAYLVERGALQVTRGGRVLAELGPGSWVGEMSLLLDEPRTATVIAATEAQLRPVTRDSFGRLLAEDPHRTQDLVRQLARRVKDASDRLARRT